jgi:hypothetical protein
MVQDSAGRNVHQAGFMVSVARREEKGSDVNVGSHLLIDCLTGVVDAAIVVSNDSDLRLPLLEARKRVPIGLVNPTRNYLAGALAGDVSEGVGRHWWQQLRAAEVRAVQLPDPAGGYRKPLDW